MRIELYQPGGREPFTSFEGTVAGVPPQVVMLDGTPHWNTGSMNRKVDGKWVPATAFTRADFLVLNDNPHFRRL